MKSITLKNIAEIVGLVSIVASLIFVGMQLRQTQNVAQAEGFAAIYSSRREVANSIEERADIDRVPRRGVRVVSPGPVGLVLS